MDQNISQPPKPPEDTGYYYRIDMADEYKAPISPQPTTRPLPHTTIIGYEDPNYERNLKIYIFTLGIAFTVVVLCLYYAQ